MDKVQKPIDSECYAPSSEGFRFYFYINYLIYAAKMFCDTALLYNEMQSDLTEISYNICFLVFSFPLYFGDHV
jgi:hypothetical protein